MQTSQNNLTLNEWLIEMLAQRNLIKPDGRHLYQYRLTDFEFETLEITLRQYVTIGHTYIGFSKLAERPIFPLLFVLYGSEWWRRRYDGSGFTWEGILLDLGVTNADWNASQRSICVRNGLNHWKLSILERGFRFLGAVAIEGGLPMKPLAEARGGIGHLLSRVLRLANNRSINSEEIENWIIELQNWLPKSYRQPAIFILLTEVAWTVLNLKKQVGLDLGNDAITKLDSKIPNWRNQFPLPVEDKQAQQLIEQLVREAANVRIRNSSICLPVERLLEINSGEWSFSSNINLPETIEVSKIATLFQIEQDEVPKFGELSVTVNEKRRTAIIRQMAGSGNFRFEDATWGFSDENAAAEHLLQFITNDGRNWSAAAIKGQPLDDELPWIFSSEMGGNSFRFVGQGGGGVAENEAMIVLPPDWKICPDFSAFSELQGELNKPARTIYKINETVLVESANGSQYKIAVKSAQAESESYEWRGKRWWLSFVNPTVVFRGIPKLCRVDGDGNAITVTNGISCSAMGSSLSNLWLGPVWLTHAANGEIRQRTKAAILPDDAVISIKPIDTLSGHIIFENWQLSNAFITTENINLVRKMNGNSLVMEVSIASDHRVPDQITFELFWRNSSTPVKLRMPFPSKGTRAFDSDGNEIFQNSLLAKNQLFGVRLNVISGGIGKKIKLKLQTEDGKVVRNFNFKPQLETVSLEIKLTDYLTDLEHLLSLNDGPDAKVKAVVLIENTESFSLNIARYSAYLELNEQDISIRTGTCFYDQGDASPVYAIRLEDSATEPIKLPLLDESSEEKSKWLFDPETREPGSWLIFPAKDSDILFRPTLWTISGELEIKSQFAQATNISDPIERHTALTKLVEDLAEDFSHPCWEEVCRLADYVGHLPLSTLDIWRRFAHSVKGMAALAFRLHNLPKGFVSRFEKELTFAWETVPFEVWKKAIKQAFKHSQIIFGEELGETLFEGHAKNRINKLAANHGGLSYLLGIASVEFFPESEADLQMLRQLCEHFSDSLFNGENSPLMKLRRIMEDWESDQNGILRTHWESDEVKHFLYPEKLGYQNDIINTPLLLAAEAAIGRSNCWLKDPAKIHLLRTFRAFSPEWFDEAYNITIVRCLGQGLLDG